MTVAQAINTRHSIRKYSSRPVEEEKISSILEAARLAPSANNSQSWRFVVVRDARTKAALAEACGGQNFVAEAPVVLVSCALRRHTMTCGQPSESVDLSIATSFMILEACEQGLGTCWLGFFYQDQVKKVLHIPEEVEVVAVVPLGYPAEQPQARPRKSVSEIVSYEQF